MSKKYIYTLLLLFATLQTFAQDYEYDANNRLSKVTYSDGSTVTYTYDELGNRLSMKKIAGIENEVISFADPIVRFICVNNWDEDGDGELSYDEAAAVTDFGDGLFESKDITSFDELQFFTGLTNLGRYTFYSCDKLTSIKFPNSLTDLGWFTLSYCSSLESVIIPESVKTINPMTFNDCINIASIVVEEGNTVFDSRENSNAIIKTSSNCMIAGCKNTVIPNTVKSLECTFYGISSLASITIPNSVKTIDSSTFYGCTGLTSVTIPSSVTKIGTNAFYGCDNLESVYSEIPNPFTINEDVFQVWDPNASTESFTTATLFVPTGTREAYLATPAWNQFLNIFETDPIPTTGDVDGDGDVSSTDITALLSIIFDNNSGEPSHKTADVNGDGTIDIADITALVNIILGK